MVNEITRYNTTLQASTTISNIATTGIYTELKKSGAFQEKKAEAVNLITSIVENKINENFHNNLNKLEKMGFISKEKIQRHQRNVSMGKFTTSLGANAIIDTSLALLQYYQQKRDLQKAADFLTASLAYASDDPASQQIKVKMRGYYRNWRGEFNLEKFNNNYESYLGCNVTQLPELPMSFDGNFENLFMNIATGVDTENYNVKNRLLELGDVLGLEHARSQELILIADDAAQFNSSSITITNISLITILSDLCESWDYAREAAIYNEENDLYHQMRVIRKDTIIKAGTTATKVGTTAAAMIAGVYAEPAADALIMASLPLLYNLIDNGGKEISYNTAAEIHNRLKKQKANK